VFLAIANHDDLGVVRDRHVHSRWQPQQFNKVVDFIVIQYILIRHYYFELDAYRLHEQHNTKFHCRI